MWGEKFKKSPANLENGFYKCGKTENSPIVE